MKTRWKNHPRWHCRYCNTTKDPSDFSPHRSMTRCKECWLVYGREYNKKRYIKGRAQRGQQYTDGLIARQRRPCPFTPTECAYAAGFVDGEGCISVYAQKSYDSEGRAMAVRVSNTVRSVIEWFHARWGGSIGQSKAKGNQSVAYHWAISANKALLFLDDIYPYLLIKKRQAKWARRYQRYVISRRWPNRTEKAWRLKVRFAEEFRIMNRRGRQDTIPK